MQKKEKCFNLSLFFFYMELTIADPPKTGSDTLDSILGKSDQTLKDLHQGFLNLANVNTDAQFKKKVEDSVRNFGDTISNKLKTLKEEVCMHMNI